MLTRPSSTNALVQHLIQTLLPVVTRYNLGFEAFGVNISTASHSAGVLRLTTMGRKGLEPSPVSPVNTGQFNVLSGTIHATWETGIGKAKNESIIVAPTLATANTGEPCSARSIGELH